MYMHIGPNYEVVEKYWIILDPVYKNIPEVKRTF